MSDNLPKHLGIIMDGNRRWAREKGLPPLEGHRVGYEVMKRICQWCLDRGILMVTVFAFSTENWSRTKEEVGYLMNLLQFALDKELDVFHQRNVRLNVIGRLKELPEKLRASIAQATEKTKNNTRGVFNIAINYGGRPEIVDAVKKIVATGVEPEEVTEELISQNLYFPSMPAPDFIIRTSGELRTSGFLLWESAYAELYFIDKYWPDFSEKDLNEALAEYARRQRRFGA